MPLQKVLGERVRLLGSKRSHLSRFKIRNNPAIALVLIWLVTAVNDRLWFAIDRRIPAWDQADYLNWVLEYWHILQTPEWFSGEWWYQFWLASPKIPPLVYATAAPFLSWFGRSPDATTLVMLFYSAILILSVYGLGRKLGNSRMGLWSAGLCTLLPGLYRYRLDFLLDYPLAAMVAFSLLHVTLWHFSDSSKHRDRWILAILMGISIGLALLSKQTALFFLFTPIAISGISTLYHRQWQRFLQWLSAMAVALLILYPWVRTNWLLILTSGKRATVDSAIAEGDPALHTLDAWLYYWKAIPELVSWPLLLMPIIGAIGFAIAKFTKSSDRQTQNQLIPERNKVLFLGGCLVGAYLLCSLNVNKDIRYILPALPLLCVPLAWGLCQWESLSQKWAPKVRWGTIGLASLLLLLNLYPLGGARLTQWLSPRATYYPYWGSPAPHAEIIDEIIATEPYLKSNVGVLPSTPTINQHNINYYGQLQDFQVHGRQVGTNSEYTVQDGRSLSWFITKTGDPGSVPSLAQQQITQFIETSGLFAPHRSWPLDDGSTLTLHHQTTPSVQVIPLEQNLSEVRLYNLYVSSPSPPGYPVPVTYQWRGPWRDLRSGLVLVTWYRESDNSIAWIHDHGFGMGRLYAAEAIAPNTTVQVTELTSMLPPADLEPGNYRLEIEYLPDRNPETTARPISLPPISITLSSEAPPQPASELDLSTQFRTLAATLSQGPVALDRIFAEIGRINQYDANQDYLLQCDRALSYRLQTYGDNPDWWYGVVLSRVLRQDIPGAISAINSLITLEPNNPYPHAYLAVVYLYNWQPQNAQNALEVALQLNPDEPEIQALHAISLAMQGRLLKAWQLVQTLSPDN
ncbi:glycosyltransferase family 39 protein [Roseofilum casamattae]|uniref:Phospholipid carrier-dependent glycosyltransferase n=1 Tax=Roseofilum casamattae BLCC-M143 TaxID=3022442 RepID=A0ABT7BU22_9CYAN|nr:glycosyltransferase family 39 protein [Roseofilum casamattae]MDJ1182680.1 phospholipid carrier-dependent glycosyltransferase [Roseofilum casamattae BLCC-M143]